MSMHFILISWANACNWFFFDITQDNKKCNIILKIDFFQYQLHYVYQCDIMQIMFLLTPIFHKFMIHPTNKLDWNKIYKGFGTLRWVIKNKIVNNNIMAYGYKDGQI